MKKKLAAMLLAAVMVVGLLPLSACSGGQDTTAATMHLRRTEGTVAVSDGGGKDVPVLDNLGLYSGYGVNTRSASYAWIDLDDVKLAKLDQNSKIVIEKEGKALDIRLRSGSLYFNVTEPLADDETMNISTSTMLVGIRGTCGWVEDNDGLSRVYILEGKVECSAEGETVRVYAGEYAELTADGELTVREFTDWDLPAFVRDEVDDDWTGGPETQRPTEPPEPTENPDITEPTEAPEPTENPGITEPTEAPENTFRPEGDVLDSGNAGGLKWEFYSDNTLVISGTGNMKNYTYDNLPWADVRDDVSTVYISDGVTSIGAYAFYVHDGLTGVTIPYGVTSIGENAFCVCGHLIRVTIPDSVTEIGESAFAYCSNMTDITIGSGVTSIGDEAFAGCRVLTDVYYGGSESQWEQIVFGSDNDYLRNATIHYNSTGPAPGTDSDFAIQNGVLVKYSGAGGNVIIPDGVTSIGEYAFSGCTGLTGVSIPNSVTSIGYMAFGYCSGLTGVNIPADVTSIGKYAFTGCTGLTDVTIPGRLTVIEADTFSSCKNLASVTIPAGVTKIEQFAFRDCSSLTDVYYGGSASQWAEVFVDNYYSGNSPLLNAAIHYNSDGPDETPGPGGSESPMPTPSQPGTGGDIYEPTGPSASDVNLEDFLQNTLDTYEFYPRDVLPTELVNLYYPGLTGIPVVQRLVSFPRLSIDATEFILVQVANSSNVSAVINILQARIDAQVNGGNNLPNTFELWRNNSRIVSHGNYIMLIVHSDCDAIVSDFNALF